MSNVSAVTEMFGAFYIQVDGVTSAPYATEAEAEMARATAAGAAEATATATAYTKYKGLANKNAKGKINVIVDFLAWVDAGCPTPETAEVVTDVVVEDSVEPTVETVAEGTDLDEGDESWMNA